ncbi:hypothetical protein RJD38_11805 [Vibrio scophthalmi]|uniref:Uncharacterized protein n=2 Tax=Vibrio scophthalmi TaxID=45658 RepID=A0A1B1NMN1_9VIBR|nr:MULTISPECIES: hypothetical protein [Vibrio]ANS84989.1 hypothetical protein VSVS12_01222 [Vibrio scophthalmi]ANU36902.1 hypothetical protein VSVS05_01777 [Vibrio scophthalmi]EGU29422.1 hypothetical protein VIBRN418_14401 [Vibrio sp. N418]EGU35438.1 hypothetical protein VIS19158_19532 [Vibrio scophthalmi LMG 19158]MCY9802058.1 hypothetical protein [Vibrio scophthalmi]
MDKELLARKLYSERVNALLGDCELDQTILTEKWDCKASPSEAARAMIDSQNDFDGPAWLARYLHRR